MQKKFVVRLADGERELLAGLLIEKRIAAQNKRRAQILLKADAKGPNWSDAKIAEAFDCSTRTVEYLRQRLVAEGVEVVVHGQAKCRVRRKVLDGEQEAKIIALRLGSPPKGFVNWTLRLLAE